MNPEAAGSPEPARSAGAAASKGVLGRGSIYTIGTVAPILASVAVVPVVTRLLGKDAYGVVAIAITVMWVAMMAASLGIPSVITRQGILAGSGVAGARALLVRGSLMTAGIISAAIVSAPLWGQLVHASVLEAVLRRSVVLALAASAFFVVVENSQALLRVLDRPVAFVALSLTATLGGPLLGLALLASSGPVRSPERYLTGLAAGYAAAAVVGLVLCLRGGRPRRDRGDTRAALRMGLPVIPHLVALYLANGALVFLAARLYDVPTSGRLQLALLVGSSPAVITSALNNSWAPIVYRAPEHERGAVLAHSARDIATLAALISGGVALLSPWLMRFVAGPSFRPLELVPAVAITAFGCVLSLPPAVGGHSAQPPGRPHLRLPGRASGLRPAGHRLPDHVRRTGGRHRLAASSCGRSLLERDGPDCADRPRARSLRARGGAALLRDHRPGPDRRRRTRRARNPQAGPSSPEIEAGADRPSSDAWTIDIGTPGR